MTRRDCEKRRIMIRTIIIAFSLCKLGLCWLHMAHEGSVIVATVGENLNLECDFQTNRFNLFDNPLLWEKSQYSSGSVQINMMGKILEPFAATNRFRTKLTQNPPKYSLLLSITDVRLEDNGNYTCIVNGPENKPLGYTQHALIVKSHVNNIFITNSEIPDTQDVLDTDYTNITIDNHQRALVYTENDDRPLRCLVHGGHPPPNVTVHLGQRDVTVFFRLRRVDSVTGVPGLQMKRTVTELVYRPTSGSDNFRIGPEDDGKNFRCTAITPDVAINYSSARIIVQYAPKVHCEPKSVSLIEANVFLSCEIRARPKPSISWIIDANGTTVKEEEEKHGYFVNLAEHRKGLMETQLILRKVTIDSFRSYEVMAENSVGSTRCVVEMTQKLASSSQKPHVSRSYIVFHVTKDRRLDYGRSISKAGGASWKNAAIHLIPLAYFVLSMFAIT